MKGVVFKKVGFFDCLFLNRLGKVFEKPVKGVGGGYFHLIKEFGKGFSFGRSSFLMIFFRLVEKFKKIFTIKPGGITKSLKRIFADLQVNTLRSLFGNGCFLSYGEGLDRYVCDIF